MTQDKLRMQMLAGIITEGQYKKLIKENYSVQDFVTDFNTEDFFKPFLQAVATNKLGLDMNKSEDWNKIITMDRKQLQSTFGLTMGIAMKLYNALGPKIADADFTTVNGRAARLNKVFNEPGNSDLYAEFKAMNDHFINGGKIENLEGNLKNIYNKHYKIFTKEQFIEIFKKVKLN